MKCFATGVVTGFGALAAQAALITVTSTADAGPGSFRQALLDANLLPGADVITFNIPGAGPHVLRPASALPAITDILVIDGFTQSGAHANTLALGSDARMRIELDGSLAVPSHALVLTTNRCTIRGLVINRFAGSAIRVLDGTNNVIEGNFIGTDVTGTQALPNDVGVYLYASAGATVGGDDPGQGNLISGNARQGIFMEDADHCAILGNVIGVDATGVRALGNGSDGLLLLGGQNRVAKNLISGNAGNGIYLHSSSGNVIQANLIGPDSAGVGHVGNVGAGIRLGAGAAMHTVGGRNAEDGNLIAFNAAGIRIDSSPAITNNALLGNAIHSNTGLGIDLGDDGVTLNDPDGTDADAGPNHRQNFPILTEVTSVARGFLKSRPGTLYRLEFFTSRAGDPSGYGEGEVFLGATNVLTDGAGDAGFMYVPSFAPPLGARVTATATDPAGNTSEFSPVAAVTLPGLESPRVRVNDRIVSGNVAVTNIAEVRVEAGLSNRYLFYSIDGSDPGFGFPYTRPFAIRATATIRVVAFDAGFARLAEAPPVFIQVIIQDPPTIVRQPRPAREAIGDAAVFDVEVTGTTPLRFQWQHNGVLIGGATNDALVLPNLQAVQAGDFQVAIANDFGAITSHVATLIVESPPRVASQPLNTSVSPGQPAVLQVDPAGTGPFRYQWRKNGVPIPNATNSRLTFVSVGVTNGGRYDVFIANAVGNAQSSPVELIVRANLGVAGGDFFREPITLDSASAVFAVSGSNTFASRQPGEPDHAGKPGSNSVWFQWTAPATGIAEFRTAGSSFDTLLGVYRGGTFTNLTLVARGEDNGDYLSSVARFNAAGGVSYAIAVDGFAGDKGRYVLAWRFTPTNAPLPVLLLTSQPPAIRTVLGGLSVDFAVTLDPRGPPADTFDIQWHFNQQPLPGANGPFFSIGPAQPGHAGSYHAAVTNRATRQGIVSEFFELQIGTQTNGYAVDKYQDLPGTSGGGGGGGAARFSFTASSIGSTPALYIRSGEVDSQFVNFSLATGQFADGYRCGAELGGTRSKFWRLISQEYGTCFLNTYGSRTTNGTILVVFSETSDGALELASVLACANGSQAAGGAALQFNVERGKSYRIMVDGKESGTNFLRLNWGVNAQAPPSTEPGVQPALRGSTHTFAVGGFPAGTEILGYEWRHDGTTVSPTAGDRFTLANVQTTDAGLYEVVITTTAWILTNRVGRLTVDTGTQILAISTFDNDAEGWMVAGGGTSPRHDPLGGNPQGHIAATSVSTTSGVWSWVAPPRFLGNRRAAYGGYLRFDLRQSISNAPLPELAHATFTGANGRTMAFRSAKIPGVTWTSLLVPLVETAPGWTSPGNMSQFLETLANLTGIQLQGRFSTAVNTVGLDNVMLVDPFLGVPLPDVPLYLASRAAGRRLQLEVPAWRRPLHLEYTDNLATPPSTVWVPLFLRPASGTPSAAEFEMTEPRRFFRLRQD